MKLKLLITLLFLPVFCYSQTTLPNVYLDSMIWEVSKGRACGVLVEKQSEGLKAQGFELLQTQQALKLQKRQTSDCDTLVNLANQKADLIQRSGELENRKLRKGNKKLKLGLGLAILYGALKTF